MPFWLELATHLGQPLQVVQATTTSMEFVIWMRWLKQKREKEIKRHEKQDWYMAQLAAEVRRSWVSTKQKKNIKTDMFLMKFDLEESKKEKKIEDPETRMQRSKSFWSALLSPKKGKK